MPNLISRFKLQNFKSVGPAGVDLELAPLTILIGPNGAGKTSLLEAIGLIVQSANVQNRSGFVLDGSLMRASSDELLFHGASLNQPMRFDFTFSPAALQIGAWWTPHLDKATLGYRLEYGARQSIGATQQEIAQTLSLDGVEAIRAEQMDDNRTTEIFTPGFAMRGYANEPDRILSERLFGQIASPNKQQVPNGAYDYLHHLGQTVHDLAAALKESTAFLSSTRGADLYVQSIGDVALTTGRFGEGTVRVLSALQADVSRTEALKSIREWGARFGLANLTGGWVGREELRLDFIDPKTGAALPISMAGAGSKHILPFIVECFAARRPRLLLVDEPEQGLHPTLQIALAELFAQSIARGNQLLLCTQSPTLVLGVCALVAQKKLSPDAVAIYSLEREENETKAQRNLINESGAIEGGWFQHFAKAERELLEKFLPGESDAAATA